MYTLFFIWLIRNFTDQPSKLIQIRKEPLQNKQIIE